MIVAKFVTGVVNPWGGVTPNINVFGITFSSRLTLILGGLWALAMVAAGVAVLMGGAKWSWAVKVSHSSEGAMEAAGQFKGACMGLAAVAGVSVITGAIIWMVQGS
jgi:hypothetical protein